MQRIFVGDVQGCADELEVLIDRATAAFGDAFSLWVAGDLVNRGPGNLQALRRVRALVEAGRAEYVLGNHEIHLISAYLGLRELSENDSIGDVLESPDAAEWVGWLRERPLVVASELDGQRFAMVHASCGAGWSLEELVARGEAVHRRLAGAESDARAFLATDPADDPVRDDLGRLTRGRSGEASGAWSSREPETPEGAWHVAWAGSDPDYGLVYGHWARQGLHVAPGLRGLDTGCVHHGRGRDGFLTAWLPESLPRAASGRAFDLPDDRFCRSRRNVATTTPRRIGTEPARSAPHSIPRRLPGAVPRSIAMAKVLIPVVFQGPTRGESEAIVEGETIAGCFDLVEERFPGLKELVIDPATGEIHKFVKVTLNGELLERDTATLAQAVSATDEIEVIAAIAGG